MINIKKLKNCTKKININQYLSKEKNKQNKHY